MTTAGQTHPLIDRVNAATRWFAAVYALPLSRRLAIAAAAVALSAALRASVTGFVGDRLPYAAFYPAVEIAAALGGFVPGVFATAASALIAYFAFCGDDVFSDRIALALFIFSCAFLSALMEALHRTRQRLEESQSKRSVAEQLNIATKHFDLAVSVGAVGVWRLELPSNQAIVSGAWRAMFGFAPDAVINPDAVYAIVHPDDAPQGRAALQGALDPESDGLYSTEYRIRRPSDGKIRCIAVRGQVLFEDRVPVRIVGVSRDVTDERAAGRALLERTQVAEQLASVAAAAPGVIFSFERGAANRINFRYLSPKSLDVLGIDPALLCSDPEEFYRRADDADSAEIGAALAQSSTEMTHWEIDFRFHHPSKGQIWLEAQAAPISRPEGEALWHGYLSDVTARKNSEISLAQTAARLQATIDGAQDAVITMSEDGRIQSVNKAGLAMFGYDAADIIGMGVDAFMSAVEPAFAARLAEFLGPRDGLDGHAWELDCRRSNGEIFPAEFTISEARYDHERLLVGFIKDLSEQRRILQSVERLRQDSLGAMGGMAATLAHEINQPLTATATYLKVARRLLEKLGSGIEDGLIEVIDKAAGQTLRAGRIVNNLRQLVAHGEADKTKLHVHPLIHEARDLMLAEGVPPNLKLTIDCAAESDAVIADRTQVKQVLINLMRNSIEAMQDSERRELTVRTGCQPDGMIHIDVIDTGAGLQDGGDGDYFAPFATTKPTGMGVGLSISRSIVEAHYGKISACPNPDGGAIFSFTLPLQNANHES